MCSRLEDDRGVALPLFAIMLVALLSVAGLVIDGGQAYAQRRQMQNAADAAAMAGTAALDDARFTSPAESWTRVQSEVDRIAKQANGAETVISCTVIDSSESSIGPCTTQAAVLNANAVGVRVEVEDTRTTTFAQVMGVETVSAQADAAAAVQPIVGGRAPWAVCSSGDKYDILTPTYKIDPTKAAALGEFVIQGSQVYKDDDECAAKKGGGGGAASFKGPIDQQILQVGENVLAESDPGNNLPSGWQSYLVTCSAPPTTKSCILLPVAYRVTGTGTNATVHVADFAYFRVHEGSTGGEKLLGTFVAVAGPAEVAGTITGNGVPTAGQVRTVSLVE